MDDRRFLGSFDDKDDAIRLRDDTAKSLVDLGWTPEITVGYERIHGVGGFGVWLHKTGDQPWPEPPFAWHVALLAKHMNAR